jgi:site-specific DNA-adenine methylase
MKPFFSYFGSKYKLAKLYGDPRHDLVIEPFAGSAAYSVYWEPKKVILLDTSPVIVSIWNYLIAAKEQDILDLPTEFDVIADLGLPYGAENLIGFWAAKGKVTPARTKSKWGKQYADSPDCKVWGEPVKRRIASQLEKIRHWQCFEAHYNAYPHIQRKTAHWFIDPPYQVAGKRYPYKVDDYTALAEWAKERDGFVQFCENDGADYLRFVPLKIVDTYRHMKTNGERILKVSKEVLYEQGE